MARISKKSQQAEATTAKAPKVGRVTKAKAASGQQAPAKAAKAPRKGKAASGQQAPAKAPRKAKAPASGQQARRAIANGTLRLTPEGKAHPGFRGARGECWALVVANNGKPAANVIGQQYDGRNGPREFDASFIAFFRDEGLVTVE